MSRKAIVLIFALLMCLSAVLLVSCGEEKTQAGTESTKAPEESYSQPGSGTEPHVHDFSVLVSETRATCTERGERTLRCSCGETVTETVAATGHSPSSEYSYDGPYHWKTCTVCGEKIGEEVHKMEFDVVDVPSCSKYYRGKDYCSICGYSVTIDGPTSEHDAGEPVVTVIKQPTCTEDGYYEEETRCRRCSEVIWRTKVNTPALGHDYENGVCTRCGEKDPDFNAGKSIKLLAIGNSFSSDALAYGTSGENKNYLIKFLTDLGYTDITIGSLEVGSCSLKMHYESAVNGTAYLTATDGYKHFYLYKDGVWTHVTSAPTMMLAVTAEDWDFVTMQEVSGNSGMRQGLTDYLPTLIKFVRDNCGNKDVKIGWHSTWAYMIGAGALNVYQNSQAVMYESIIDVLKYAETFDGIDFFLPSGTAIQNIRTSYVGETINRDNSTHMSYGLGRYTASMVWAAVLSGQDVSTFKKLDGFTDYEQAVVVESVSNALKNPYNYTKSNYPYSEAELKYVEQGYTLFDWQAQDAYYLNGSKLPSVQTSTERNLSSAVAFTKADIPAGSVIVCCDKFSCSIELWPDASTAGKRVTQKQNTTLTVDDAMWNGYSLIAFTLKSTISGGPRLTGMADIAAHNLRIWVKK